MLVVQLTEYPASEVIEKMLAKIKANKEALLAGAHADKGQRGTLFKEIANLTLQTTLYAELFTADCMLCFKRNWKLNGIPFRTTWSAGWYLNFL